MDLKDISDGKLVEELARRKAEAEKEKIEMPKPLLVPNWQRVKHLTEDLVNDLSLHSCVNENTQAQLFEAVIEAVYGNDIWQWWNSKVR